MSLEDETGIANLVVMPDVYERFRPVVRGAPFLLARGRVERSGQVVNVQVESVAPLALAPPSASGRGSSAERGGDRASTCGRGTRARWPDVTDSARASPAPTRARRPRAGGAA